MLEVAGNDHGKYQLSLIVGERRIHEAADLAATNLLTQRLVQHRRYVQVKRLVGQIYKASRGKSSPINDSFEVVGLCNTVLDVEVAGKLRHVGKPLRRIGYNVAQELPDRRQFVQQVKVHQLAVVQVQTEFAVQAASYRVG